MVACGSGNSGGPGVLGGTGGQDSGSVFDSTAEDSSAMDTGTMKDGASHGEGGACSDAGEAGLSLCNNLCTNLLTDVANCGACGHNCAGMGATAFCVAGGCVCAADAGSSLCGTTCVDTLTDPNNCGTCGHVCQAMGGMCSAGLCLPTVIAQAPGPIWDITVTSTNIWWTQPSVGGGAGALLTKPFASQGTITNPLGGNLANPHGLVYDGALNVFWVDFNDTTVNELAVAGTTREVDWPAFGDAGPIPPEYANANDVAVDGTYIYWVANGAGSVLRVPIGSHGSVAPTVLSSGQDHPYAIAIQGSNVFWVNQGSAAGNGSVMQQVSDGSSAAIAIATGEPQPADVAADAHNVYWVDKGNPGFVKQAPVGGGAVVILAQNEGAPTGIAVDAMNVYWTAFSDNTVNGIAIGGNDGGVKTLYAQSQVGPSAIAVDAKNLYWVNSSNNTISEISLR